MAEPSGGALVAGLPMYDWPEVRWATDALWTALAERLRTAGIAAPGQLDRSLALDDLWRHPKLLFGQTCGYPYITKLRDAVALVATPGYTARGCAGADYSSMIVVRVDEPAESLRGMGGRVAAINQPSSFSGCLALRVALAQAGPAALPRGIRLSGSHRESLRLVARGEADLCAIDAVCWGLALRHEPKLTSELRVLAQTDPAPALPFISAAGLGAEPIAALRSALADVLADPDLAEIRAALLLSGTLLVDENVYDHVAALERAASEVTLRELA